MKFLCAISEYVSCVDVNYEFDIVADRNMDLFILFHYQGFGETGVLDGWNSYSTALKCRGGKFTQ